MQSYQILEQEPQHSFSPTQYKTYGRTSTHYAIENQEHTWFNPTQYKTYRTTRTHYAIEPETNHYLSINRTYTPAYSLALGDGTANAVFDGRISLLRDGVVIQTIEVFPPTTTTEHMILTTSGRAGATGRTPEPIAPRMALPGALRGMV